MTGIAAGMMVRTVRTTIYSGTADESEATNIVWFTRTDIANKPLVRRGSKCPWS